MDFAFDIDKAVAAAGYVTQRCGGQISGFLLIKIMYGAEREALASWHRPITGDSFACLKKGPILSRTYDLIKGSVLGTNSDMVKWSQHFSPRSGHNITLLKEPNFDVLSEQEIKALEKSAREISALVKKKGLIADTLHQQWPEWKDPEQFGRGSIPLSIEDVLSEVLEDDDIDQIVSEIKAVGSAKAALQVAAA